MLRAAILILQRQREVICRDIGILENLQAEYLRQPHVLLDAMKSGSGLPFPPRRHVMALPPVDIGKVDDSLHTMPKVKVSRQQSAAAIHYEIRPRTMTKVPDVEAVTRLRAPNKQETQSQFWTDEEHQKFLKLLDIFPDEPVASHRWQKIADALGNRTARQVASHAQKYFIRLTKLGQPLPGGTYLKVTVCFASVSLCSCCSICGLVWFSSVLSLIA